MSEKSYWFFRCKDPENKSKKRNISFCLENSVITYGWSAYNLSENKEEHYHNIKNERGTKNQQGSIAKSFASIKQGDIIVLPDDGGVIHICLATSNPLYNAEWKDDDAANYIEVDRKIKCSKKDFSSGFPKRGPTIYKISNDSQKKELDILLGNKVMGLKNDKSITSQEDFSMPPSKNIILYGPPGTGKTFLLKRRAVELIKKAKFAAEEKKEIDKIYKEYIASGQIVFTTFHQSLSYENFIEGIRAQTRDGQLYYEVTKGIFAEICTRAEYDPENNYVLLIDEINRGNVSAIFGELITLLEDDKRQGEDNELAASLPYSKESFSVPTNLFIIATMNTADRSIEALDTALRRRFSFEEMLPEYNLLCTDCDGIDLQKMLKCINNSLCILLDRERQIGHAYLWYVTNKEQLQQCFQRKILPLLQEYFYGDYEKIFKVLGNTFIAEVEIKQFPVLLPQERRRYFEIKSPESWDFAAIYSRFD